MVGTLKLQINYLIIINAISIKNALFNLPRSVNNTAAI